MAVAISNHRRDGGDGGDSGICDIAIQGADGVWPEMVILVAPLLPNGDDHFNGLITRALRSALARVALVGTIGDGGAAGALAHCLLVRAAESI